jgi:hypothetical protein
MNARPTEAQCQRTVVDAARAANWFIYHNRPSQTGGGRWHVALQGHGGFPDLVLVHAGARQIWFVELKRRPNRLGSDQQAWGAALEAAGGDWRVVWVPDELDLFCQLLADVDSRARIRRNLVPRNPS